MFTAAFVYNSQDMEVTQVPIEDEWVKSCGTFTQWSITWP